MPLPRVGLVLELGPLVVPLLPEQMRLPGQMRGQMRGQMQGLALAVVVAARVEYI